MDVGVRELKARLSSYLRRAADGEVITITDRGAPIASLGPLTGRVDLSTAVADGWVEPATNTGLGPARRATSTRSIAEVLDEDRGS